MKHLYLEVAAAGGTTFRTGTSLRNHLLGLPYSKEYLVIYKLSREKLIYIIKKLEMGDIFETETFSIRLIENIQELNEQTDFSIHSIYLNPLTDIYYDPFRGIADLKNKIISAPRKLFLGNPVKMIEACRLAGDLGFSLNVETWFDLYDNAQIVKYISPDSIRKELEISLLSKSPSLIFKQLQEARLLEYILPELAACETVIQSKRSGVSNVFEHVMYALDACEPILDLRLTILLHDIAKPQTLQCDADGTIHFFKHEIIGSKIARTYLKYWNFPKEIVHKVPHLIQHHMFDADPRMTEKSVRRLIRKVGKEYIYDLLKIREADRGGTPEKISMRKIKLLRRKIEKELTNVVANTNNSQPNIADDSNVVSAKESTPGRHDSSNGRTVQQVVQPKEEQ